MARCPLWVISGHMQCKKPYPLYPRKRTLGVRDAKWWSVALKVQTMLARALRLAPHSRSGPKATARRAPSFSVYDVME